MSIKLHYLIGIVLILSLMPIHGRSQTTGDQPGGVKVEETQTKHAVKKSASSRVKQGVSKGYHATAQATKKGWAATKHAVGKGYHATAAATGKAWRGTKRVASKGYHKAAIATGKAWHGTKKAVTKAYNSTVHPSPNTSDKTKENNQSNQNQDGGSK